MLVILGLGIIWGLVLAPDAVRLVRNISLPGRGHSRSRSRSGPAAVTRSSITGVLGTRPAPREMQTTSLPYGSLGASAARISRQEAQRRRAMGLFILGVAVVFTAVLAVAVGGFAIPLNLLFDVLLGSYVYMLASRTAVRREQRASNVHYLPQRTAPAGFDTHDGYEDEFGYSGAVTPLRRTAGW